MFSVLFSTVITSIGEDRAGLCASRAFVFVYFARVNIYPVSLPFGVRDWLRFVILASLELSINHFVMTEKLSYMMIIWCKYVNMCR